MASKNLFQRIKDWFTGGSKSNGNRASSYRGSSNIRATNTFSGSRTSDEDERRKKAQEEQKAKIEKAFAVSVKTKADDSNSKKKVDTSNKSTKAWKKTAEKELGVTDAKSNRLAQLDSKYWQKQEEHSAKYNPLALSTAKGAVSGVTLNADKLMTSADKKAKANQEKVQKIMEKNGGEKAVKRANALGEFAGTMATFGLGTGGAKAGIEGTKAVTKATSKLANSEIIKKASARAIEKGLAKGSVEEVSQQLAKKLATELGADITVDNTLGLLDATTRASLAEDGEKGKEFLTNVGINALATGTLDLAPTLVRGLKGAKALKNVEKKELKEAIEKATESYKVRGSKGKVRDVEGEVVQHGDFSYGVRETKQGKFKIDDVTNGNTVKKSFDTREEALAYAEQHSKKNRVRNPIEAKPTEESKAIVPEAKADIEPRANELASVEPKPIEEPLAQEVAESPTAKVLEQDIKNIEEGKPLDAPVEQMGKAELPEELNSNANPLVGDNNIDSNSPYIAGTLKQNMERNGMNVDEYEDLFSALGDMNVETIYRDFSSKNLDEIYDMSEIKPVADLEAEGVPRAETQTTSYTDQILFKEEYEKIRKKSRDSKDVNISQSNLKEQAMAKTAEHRRKIEESVRKKSEEYKKTLELTTQQRLDRDGLSANEVINKTHDITVGRRNTIDAYDASFQVIHVKDMGQKCATYVSQNPALVMKYLHEKITKNIPLVSADYFFADALVDYGQIWEKSSAIEIGKLAKNGYMINTARNSGVVQYCSRIFHSLDPSQKIRAISKMFVDITDAVGKHADNTEDLINSLNTFYKDNVADLFNMRSKDDNGIFRYTIDMLEGENPPSYVDVLVDNIVHSTDEKFITDSQNLLRTSATEMCPPNILSTWIAIRFTSMLSNIKTHAKNLMGGVGVALTKGISDMMAGTVQEALYKSGVIKERSRAVLTPAEFKNNILSTKGEYGEIIKTVGAEDVKGIKEHTRGLWDRSFDRSTSKRIPKVLKPIFALQKVIGTGLELEDGVFIEYFYRKSLCEYLKANGYKAGADFVPTERFKDAETLLNVARAYARDEAKEATFRKFNSLSKFLNDATRKGTSASATTSQQVGGFISHTLVPFTTPINMFVQGVKYSPLSLGTGIHKLIKASKSGSEELYLKAIDDLCAGMTGVGIATVGFWLGRNQPMSVGVHLVGGMNDDPESKAYKREGIQEYSLVKINDDGRSGFSLNLDALQPIAQTLFMGAEMGKQSLHDDWDAGSGFYDDVGNVLTVMSSVAGPIVNMSAVQGLSKLLEAPQNYPDLDAVSAMFVSLAESNRDSLVASFLSNLTRSLSPYDYNLSGTSSTDLGNALQYKNNMTSSKIPFAGKRLAPKINEFGEIVGEKKSGGDYAKAVLNNMVNPLTAKAINLSDIQVEQHRLYGALVSAGEDPEKAGAVFPYVDNRVNKTIGETSDKYGVKAVELEPMNQWERAEWQKAPSKNGNEAKISLLNTKGWNSYYGGDDDKTKARRAEVEAMDFKSTKELLNWTITQPEYQNATDKQKKQMITAVYGTAEYSGNKELYTSRGGSEAEFKLIEDVGAKYRGAWENNKNGIANIVTLEEYVDFALNAKNDYYADDGTRSSRYTAKSMKEYFNGKDLSYEQREALYNTYKAKSSKPYNGQGSGGSGGRRRSGGGSSSKSSTKSQAKLSAFKPSVKNSDFKSITKNINQDYGKVKRDFGLTDAELQAIIKQANRDSLSLRGK